MVSGCAGPGYGFAAGADGGLATFARSAAAALTVGGLAAAGVFGASAGTGGAVTGPATVGWRRMLAGYIRLIGHCPSPLFFQRLMRFQRG
jgi:hypothetical protein